jgi:hypothetical protein
MAPPNARKTSSPSKPSPLKTQYLILYNSINALLWLVILGRVLLLVQLTGFDSTYPGVGQFAKWTQTVAVLEILHAAAGKQEPIQGKITPLGANPKAPVQISIPILGSSFRFLFLPWLI